jgi:hypothetical protein
MPLSRSVVGRRAVHRRRVEIEAFLREDQLLELDACLIDTKQEDYLLASGVRRAGDPVHGLYLRMTLDANCQILAVEAVSDWVPYPGACDTIGPAYQQLVGLNLLKGFRRAASELFAETQGCTHLTELLLALPTAAIQALATFRRDTDDSEGKPFQLDRCHALDTRGIAVRAYYPRWFRGGDASPGEGAESE